MATARWVATTSPTTGRLSGKYSSEVRPAAVSSADRVGEDRPVLAVHHGEDAGAPRRVHGPHVVGHFGVEHAPHHEDLGAGLAGLGSESRHLDLTGSAGSLMPACRMMSAIACSRISADSRSMAWARVCPSVEPGRQYPLLLVCQAKFEMVVMPPASAARDPVR